MTLDQVLEMGFDRSTEEDGVISLRCSQCQAMAIQGIPTHEQGCPNARPTRFFEDDESDDFAIS